MEKLLVPSHNIILPSGAVYNADVTVVDRAVNEYDERLRFGYNQENKDYIIYIRMPRGFDAAYFVDGEPIWPVVGFGDKIPTPEEALRMLYKADTARHGYKILDDMNKQNEQIRKNSPYEKASNDAAGQLAEGIEYWQREEGKHPVPRIFVPGGKN